MARRPPERPTFEPPPADPPGPRPLPARPERDPLRAMAPVLVTLAAVGLTAVAVSLPVREARHESLQHFPSTQYIDVPPGTTPTWHNVQWRMIGLRPTRWKPGNGLTAPPRDFVRLRILLHCRLVGPKAKLNAEDADAYLVDAATDEAIDFELRDRDGRVWDTVTVATNPDQWPHYRPAKGLDLGIDADVPASEADEVTLVAKFDGRKDGFSLSKTPSPRETVLRFLR